MSTDTTHRVRQIDPPEHAYAEQLAFLAAHDDGPRPPGWRLTPHAVVKFIVGSGGVLTLPPEAQRDGLPAEMTIEAKFVGDRSMVERSVVTLAGQRGLLLVGEPGTAKSMLSELLAAAVCGTSELTVQGTAATTEDQLRYGWNYAMLLANGPSPQALVPSPVLTAMRTGAVARIEEITRCLPEVQDALVSIISDRRIAVPELAGTDNASVPAVPGFTVIATANLRDRGVSEMSAALKRRFNYETVEPIADLAAETALVTKQAKAVLEQVETPFALDEAVIEVLVTAFRDLRAGRSAEGWDVERPSTVMSTAEAVAVASSMALAAAYFPGDLPTVDLLPGHLLGVVRKDDPADGAKLLGYWDGAVRRRAQDGDRLWARLWDLRDALTN